MAVPEAPLRETRFGLVPDGDGWFVLNARDTRWRHYGPLGAACDFEGKRPFRGLGINLNVLRPGEPMAMYHRERNQERRLRAWDYVHCPGDTAHVVVGAGEGPSVVLAVGARGGRKGIVYLVEPAAVALGAGAERETAKSAEAYARFPASSRTRYREGWLPDL